MTKIIEDFDIKNVPTILSQIRTMWNDQEYDADYDLLYDYGSEGTFNGMPVVNVHRSGGGEGGAESCTTVLQFGEDAFLRIDYYYYSHEGYCFDYPTIRWVNRSVETVYVYN